MCASENCAMRWFRRLCSFFSLLMAAGLYAIIFAHFYGFIKVVCPLIKLRAGTELGMTWLAVGLVILYNILFNHFWAMMIKPGSPKDLKLIEKMRQE